MGRKLILRPEKPVVTDDKDIIEQLRQRLKKMKLRIPHRPKNERGEYMDPTMPWDITALNDEQLGRLHGEFAAMSQYAYGQLALRGTEHSISKRADRITRAKVRTLKSGTVDDKTAKTEIDSRVKKSGQTLVVAEGTERLTQAIYDGYIIGRDLCSREMTRRMNTYQPNGRS